MWLSGFCCCCFPTVQRHLPGKHLTECCVISLPAFLLKQSDRCTGHRVISLLCIARTWTPHRPLAETGVVHLINPTFTEKQRAHIIYACTPRCKAACFLLIQFFLVVCFSGLYCLSLYWGAKVTVLKPVCPCSIWKQKSILCISNGFLPTRTGDQTSKFFMKLFHFLKIN